MTEQDIIVLEKLFIEAEGKNPLKASCSKDLVKLCVHGKESISITSTQHSIKAKKRNFEYIKNKDGSIRWMWPQENKSPDFLKFYSALTAKATIFQQALKWSFYLPIVRNLVIKKLSVSAQEDLYIDLLCKDEPNKYAIFTGTVGPNRKIVVYNRKADQNEFLKIPVGESSLQSLTKEYINATLFRNHQDLFQTPKIGFKDAVLSSSDLEICTSKGNELVSETQKSLVQLMDRTIKKPVRLSKLLHEIETVPKPVLKSLKNVYNQVLESSAQETVFTCLNHGDFTPWNCFQESNPVKIFDLEFASAELPAYYDVFHFWIQYDVMCTSLHPELILSQVKTKWENSLFSDHALAKGMRLESALKNYLLYVSEHYLYVYSKQEKLHIQGKRLVDFLVYALNAVKEKDPGVSYREQYINHVSIQLKDSEHAILKEFNGLRAIVHSNSDIDLVMKRDIAERFINNLPTEGIVSKSVQKKSFMVTLELYFEDQSFLSIDFIQEFKRKSYYYLDAHAVLEHAFTGNDGLNYARPHCNTAYIILFYLLNGASVPEKYLVCFKSYPPLVFNHVSFYLKEEYGFSLEDVLNKEMEEELRKNLLIYEKRFSKNYGRKGKWEYLIDTFSQFTQGIKAPLISFSGVDGAGKTTVLYGFKEVLETRYRQKVVVIRHRPSILPILSAYVHGKEKASEISMSKLPRQGSNKNVISSLVRFLYYYLDYVVGQVVISFKYSRRGTIVLYDRYYYDFILDGIRSNITLPAWVIKPLFYGVKKPVLNFFLWASPEVILSRKKEMQKEEILELTEKYKSLFQEFGLKYDAYYETIENMVLEETMEKVIGAFITKIKRS